MKLDALVSAYKRAKHFKVPVDGKFSSLHSPVGNNYARMLYAEKDPLMQLLIFNWWAESLNRLTDQCRVAENLELREAFTSFLTLMWFDPTKLEL